MGAEKWITTKKFNKYKYNSVEAIKALKAEGFQVVATSPHNTDCTLYNLDITQHDTNRLKTLIKKKASLQGKTRNSSNSKKRRRDGICLIMMM